MNNNNVGINGVARRNKLNIVGNNKGVEEPKKGIVAQATSFLAGLNPFTLGPSSGGRRRRTHTRKSHRKTKTHRKAKSHRKAKTHRRRRHH